MPLMRGIHEASSNLYGFANGFSLVRNGVLRIRGMCRSPCLTF